MALKTTGETRKWELLFGVCGVGLWRCDVVVEVAVVLLDWSAFGLTMRLGSEYDRLFVIFPSRSFLV